LKKTDILVKDLDGNFACFNHCIKKIILVSLSNGNFASFMKTNIPGETLCLYILRKKSALKRISTKTNDCFKSVIILV
jgi:hypothetical protein